MENASTSAAVSSEEVGTSRLVSTDSEDVHSPPHGAATATAPVATQLPAPPSPAIVPPPKESPPVAAVPIAQPPIPPLVIKPPLPSPAAKVVVEETTPPDPPRKDDLKIKISLSKQQLVSNGAGSIGGSRSKKESKKELRHFKKRAIAREQGRASKRAKRSGAAAGAQDEDELNNDERDDEKLLAGVAEELRVDPIVIPANRPTFPLPGTDAYELYRTLASPSGGDDFDSQSLILGSASSNNIPKHAGIAAAEDCRIIHSRGSSDCGSDLELSQNSQNSQNSSTAAAPPSEINFESENTQDNRESLLSLTV